MQQKTSKINMKYIDSAPIILLHNMYGRIVKANSDPIFKYISSSAAIADLIRLVSWCLPFCHLRIVFDRHLHYKEEEEMKWMNRWMNEWVIGIHRANAIENSTVFESIQCNNAYIKRLIEEFVCFFSLNPNENEFKKKIHIKLRRHHRHIINQSKMTTNRHK